MEFVKETERSERIGKEETDMQYKQKEASCADGMHTDEEFFFPSNVKQMGAMDDEMKIYMEDYVYTYLYQYAKSGGCSEKMAALVGRQMCIDGENVVLISGAIQAHGMAQEGGSLRFSPETWEYIGSQLEMYFRGLTLVGWVHCQPGFGAFLAAKDDAFHQVHFKESWQVLFVLDAMDKLDGFYRYNSEQSGLQQAKGYFIYYEKNQQMQEYMLDHSMVRPRESKQQEEDAKEEETNKRVQSIHKKRRPTPEERMDAAQEIRRVLQRRSMYAKTAKKNRYAMLTGISCVLCMVCMCMGYALMNSIHRLQELEVSIASVQNAYTTLSERVDDAQVQSAFAVEQSAKTAEQAAVIRIAGDAGKEEKKQADVWKEGDTKKHMVLEGETLGQISRQYYGTMDGIAKIMEVNGIEDANLIVCGQEILIP